MERSPNDGSYLAYWGQCGNRTQYRNHREIWTKIFGLIQLGLDEKVLVLGFYWFMNDTMRLTVNIFDSSFYTLNLKTNFIRNGQDVYMYCWCIGGSTLFSNICFVLSSSIWATLDCKSWFQMQQSAACSNDYNVWLFLNKKTF